MRENNTIITVRLADNEIDRDYERFSVSALHDMAKLYAGRNGVIGEDINGKTQRGRILSCEVRTNPKKLTRSGEIYTYLEARVIIPRTNENVKLLDKLMNETQEGSISCSVRNRVCSLCGETDCTKHKKGTLYHGQLVEKILNDIIDVYEWAIVKPCDNKITEDNLKDRRIKPSQIKPTRHPPMPDTTSPKATMPDCDKEGDSFIADIKNWFSNNPRLNEYLKTRSDCGIESLASDLIEIWVSDLVAVAKEYVQRTDYDKVCELLKEIGCQFDTNTSMITGNVLDIDIKPESTISFGSVTIEFYDDGSFKGFAAED